MKRIISFLVLTIAVSAMPSAACTSLVASGKATADGRPMLWKHRDTGAAHNYLERIPASVPGEFTYVGLFNQGDTLHREAWTGMNEVGFAIMNTASYNLAPDTAKVADREGVVMALALRKCRTVADFANMLDSLPRPMGVQANFGVIDAAGNAAYFETWDHGYKPYYIGGEGEPTALVRTNFSVSGNDSTGMGYIRYDNAHFLLDSVVEASALTPEDCIDRASRSFYHSLLGHDVLNATPNAAWAVDQDFIPRYTSTASIVIVGVKDGENPDGTIMQARLGYPPVAEKYTVKVNDVPADLRPLLPGDRCRACAESQERKAKAFPIRRGSGKRYVDLDYIRSLQIR